jgi:hypothetical protein
MRKNVIVVLAALAAISWDCVAHDVFAGQVSMRSHIRKCGRYDYCGYPIVCRFGTCYSLYGAYAPDGGTPYWGRYTYSGWGYR